MEAPVRVAKRKLKQPQAPLACEACRAKKVRCDLAILKTACSRCDQRGITCNIAPGRRRHLLDKLFSSQAEAQQNREAIAETSKPSPATSTDDSSSPHSTFSWNSGASSNTQTSALSWPQDDFALKNEPALPEYNPLNSPQQASDVSSCLDMPDYSMRQQLLQAYADWIHPSLPMLDLQQLKRYVEQGPTEPSTSLLLLKSMMLAASHFLDFNLFDRMDLKQQVRTLIQNRAERDPLKVLQSLILVTYCDFDGDEAEDEYYWMTMASRYFEKMMLAGRFREGVDMITKATLWSLCTRDTVIALTKRKPCLVQQLPQACLKLPASNDWYVLAGPGAQTEDLPKACKKVCWSLQELCGIIRPALNKGAGGLQHKTSALLQAWYQRWNAELKGQPSEAASTIKLHRAVIRERWALAVLLLYCSAGQAAQQPSTSDLAARAISEATETHLDLYENNLTQHLPSTSAAALAPVAAAHLINSMSDKRDIRKQSSQKYYLCWQVLRELQSRYSAARQVMSMIDALGQGLRRRSHPPVADLVKRKLEENSTSPPSTSPDWLNDEQEELPSKVVDDDQWLTLLTNDAYSDPLGDADFGGCGTDIDQRL